MAAFFALTFAAGHLTQEVRDHQGDVLNAIRTNAVIFGPRRTFAASLALFTLAYALLLLLALQGILPRPLAALVALYPLHLRWSLKTLAEGLTYESIGRLQTRYRALYAVIGLAMVAALCAPSPFKPSDDLQGRLGLTLCVAEDDPCFTYGCDPAYLHFFPKSGQDVLGRCMSQGDSGNDGSVAGGERRFVGGVAGRVRPSHNLANQSEIFGSVPDDDRVLVNVAELLGVGDRPENCKGILGFDVFQVERLVLGRLVSRARGANETGRASDNESQKEFLGHGLPPWCVPVLRAPWHFGELPF